MQQTQRWTIGDHAPYFTGDCTSNPRFHFSAAAGRYIVLSFFGSSEHPASATLLQTLADNHTVFDDRKITFFGITIDPADRAENRLPMVGNLRYFRDMDHAISKAYGALLPASPEQQGTGYRPFTLILDPSLRVWDYLPLRNPEEHAQRLLATLRNLPDVNDHAGTALMAPALVVPRIFEPEFCRQLIAAYHEHGGTESGFMREAGGKTVAVIDDKFKRRKDFMIPADSPLRDAIRARLVRRLMPEITKAFQFTPFCIERYLVACYNAESGGFFRPHRDNTTKGTAHRQFACSINLNAEEYEGGDLRFPEFGTTTYRAPTGGAVVFSCSLLHEATPVTNGERYAFLPFFYDEAHAKIREENAGFLTGQVFNRNAGEDEYQAIMQDEEKENTRE